MFPSESNQRAKHHAAKHHHYSQLDTLPGTHGRLRTGYLRPVRKHQDGWPDTRPILCVLGPLGRERLLLPAGRLLLDVTVGDFLSARLQPGFVGGKTELKDVYLRLNFADDFQVSMGQFKRAFDLFELSSSTDLSVIERDGRIEGVSGCTVKSRVVCKSERKLLDASVRLPWRPPWARGVRGPGNGARSRAP